MEQERTKDEEVARLMVCAVVRRFKDISTQSRKKSIKLDSCGPSENYKPQIKF